MDEIAAPALDDTAEMPGEDPPGLRALRLGLGLQKIGQALDLSEVQSAVLEGAAGELSGLGRYRVGLRGERRQDAFQDRRRAVAVQLDDRLAGVAGPSGEGEDERLVEDGAVGPAQGAQAGAALRGQGAAEGLRGIGRTRSRDADHAQARLASGGRYRIDR